MFEGKQDRNPESTECIHFFCCVFVVRSIEVMKDNFQKDGNAQSVDLIERVDRVGQFEIEKLKQTILCQVI